MVVLFMVENFEMLWPLLHICVLNNFRHLRLTEEEFHAKVADGSITDAEQEAYTELGSFSVYACLKNLLLPGFYGDELFLLIITKITSMIPLGASSCAHKTILQSTEQWRIFVKTWFLTFVSVFAMVST